MFIRDTGRYYETGMAGPTQPPAPAKAPETLQIPPQRIGSFDGYDIYLQPLPPTAMVTMVVRPHPLGTVIVKRDGQVVASEQLTGQENPLAVGRRLINQIKGSAKQEETVTQPAPTQPDPAQTPGGLSNGVKLAIGLAAGAAALALLK